MVAKTTVHVNPERLKLLPFTWQNGSKFSDRTGPNPTRPNPENTLPEPFFDLNKKRIDP